MLFDFIFNEDIFNKCIFRFNTDKSEYQISKETNEILKICYNYEILWQLAKNKPIILFSIDDENSCLIKLNEVIKQVLNKPNQKFQLNTNGQPGSDWKIINKSKSNEIYFEVFNNFFDNGFRFTLSLEETYMFIDYLNKINDYMVNHKKFV